MKAFPWSAIVVVAVLPLVTGSVARSQGRESGVSLSAPAYATPANYSIAKPGELTMQVNVWGLINHPGRYEISITRKSVV